MPVEEIALGCLLDTQQSDGGWTYVAGSSWTEPTCYSILALRAAKGPAPELAHACEWLIRRQRRDGGWSPGQAVEQSTHVTSLAILALTGLVGYEDAVDRGVAWLLSQTGAESSAVARAARLVMGTRSVATEHRGWPWYPGAAAWVIPTSFAILALRKQKNLNYIEAIASRTNEAQDFLFHRQCPDHGWNHGGLFREGETPFSYPETTGIALLALHGARGAELSASFERAKQHYRTPMSGEGSNWLRLGLMAHRQDPGPSTSDFREWTSNQASLRVILAAAEAGNNPFLTRE